MKGKCYKSSLLWVGTYLNPFRNFTKIVYFLFKKKETYCIYLRILILFIYL